MQFIKNLLFKIAFLLFCYAPSLNALNIIFDLGNVLIETKYLQSMLQIGPIKMVSYALTLQNPFALHKKLYHLLDRIEKPQDGSIIVKDHDGNPLPSLMCRWLDGTISTHDLITLVDKHLFLLDNWIEQLMVRSLAHIIFNPQAFARTRYIVPEGVQFVHECKNAGHKLYILSNWDPISFTILEQLYPDFFSLFDGIVISGDVHLLKPDPAIFKYILQRYKLKKKDCLFIDDQLENVAAAQKLGIPNMRYQKKPGLIFKVPNFDAVREAINDFSY